MSTKLPRASRNVLCSTQWRRLTRFRVTRRCLSTQRTILKLNTGAPFPALGFGTWQDQDAQESAVLEALKVGYRHIDTARIYGTEKAVGLAIAKSGVPRSELFLTSKLWNNAHHPDDVEPALDESLRDLGTDYLDMYLMHWPVAWARGSNMRPRNSNGQPKMGNTDFVDTYKAMESVLKAGKTRAIGISNFSLSELQRLLQETTVVPASHQLEMHPYLQQKLFDEFHLEHGIVLTQYSPFGNQNPIYSRGQEMGKMIDDPLLVQIGKKYNKSSAQVALAWGITKGHSVIPKSKTPERIRENLEGDFRLEDGDMDRIQDLDWKIRFNDASTRFGYEFFSDLEGKPI